MNALKQILKWVLITLIAFTTFNLFISSKYKVERNIEIEAPAYVVYGEVSNLKTWEDWAVWWKQDSTLKTVYEGEKYGLGSIMIWDGEIAGKGSLEITVASFADSINTVLLFDGMKPSYGFWHFNEVDGVTKVTWGMKGEMPFFMSFMTLFFDEMAGGDFEEGLKGLKERCEAYPTKSSKVEEVDMPEQHYLYISASCSMHEISNTLGQVYGEIFGYLGENGLAPTSMPLAKWNSFPKNAGDEDIVEFDAGVMIMSANEGNDRVKYEKVEARKTLQATHYGAYQLSENTHKIIDGYAAENGIELEGVPFEIYANDPTTVLPEEVQTLIIYDVKE